MNDPTQTHRARLLNQYADFGAGDADAYSAGPERTSVMAILSLVLGVVCVPGFGVLAVLLAVLAFLGIGASKGRVGGKGLAIAGLLLGLLFTGVWIGAGWFGWTMWGFYKSGAARAQTIFAAIEAQDYTAAASEIGPRAQNLTPEQFDEFRTAYRDALGAFVDVPIELTPMSEAWQGASERLNNASGGTAQVNANSGGQGGLPLAVNFDSGPTLVIYEFAGASSMTEAPDPTDLIVILPDGSTLSLMVGLASPNTAEGDAESESESEGADDADEAEGPESEPGEG